MFEVKFQYDETFGKWEVMVAGAANATEAVQGFNAVVLTCRDATPSLTTNKAEIQSGGEYKISVGV